MSAPVSSQIDWRGVAISVSYHRHQWSEFDHIEVNVIGDGIIPITETGYRPHYLHSDVTDEYGGAVAYVLAWLEQEAQTSCAARYMTVPSPTPTLRPGAANASLEPKPHIRRSAANVCSVKRPRVHAEFRDAVLQALGE